MDVNLITYMRLSVCLRILPFRLFWLFLPEVYSCLRHVLELLKGIGFVIV